MDNIIWQQKKTTSFVEDWELSGRAMFPLMTPIATRLFSLSVRSADVERVCKTQELIQTKLTNLLKNISVRMLLYCYVNLRLLNKSQDELGEFLVQYLHEKLADETRSHDLRIKINFSAAQIMS